MRINPTVIATTAASLHYVDEGVARWLSFLDPNIKAELAQHMA